MERQIELEASPEEVWQLVCEPESWLADAGSVDLRPGGTGRLVDEGVARRVEVETVDEGARVVFRWWDEDHGEDGASRVEITVPAVGGPTRRWPSARPCCCRWRGRRCVGRGPGRAPACAGRCAWHAWPSCASPCACERSEPAIATMSDRLDGVLAALADPTRRSLFEALLARGPETATNLAGGLPVTRQAVVKHLQVLADAGLLTLAARRT